MQGRPVADRYGPYEIVASLSAGGMGEIYLARDTRLHRDVALKVLPGTIASDSIGAAGSSRRRAPQPR
jgi:eukaryotic-like serine/threonine-protein kinase